MTDDFKIYKEADDVDALGIPTGEDMQPFDYSGLLKYLPPQLQALARQGVKHLPGHHNQETHGHRGGAGLANAIVTAGGFTYTPHGREHFPAKGLALSIYPERSVIIVDRAVTRKDLRSYINHNEDLLADKTNYFGAWNDTEHHRVFLDVSKVVQDAGEARKLCEQHGQRAYFNLETFETVEVLPEAQAHKQAPPKKIEVFVVPRDATDDELDELVALLNKGQEKS